MDAAVGNFAKGDARIEGSKIVAVVAVIDATGHMVMPGLIDTHHHQFETALRSLLSDAILINDGRPESTANHYEWMLQKFSVLYRPQNVCISELFGGISQIDAGVTTVMDVNQIHHSPNTPTRPDRRPLGDHRTFLPWQANRLRPDRTRSTVVHGSGLVACANGRAVARVAC